MKLRPILLLILSLPTTGSTATITSSLSFDIDGLIYSNFSCEVPGYLPLGASCGQVQVNAISNGIEFTTPNDFSHSDVQIFYDVTGNVAAAPMNFQAYVNPDDNVFISEFIRNGSQVVGQNCFVGGYNPNDAFCSGQMTFPGTSTTLSVETDVIAASNDGAFVGWVDNSFIAAEAATPEPASLGGAAIGIGLVAAILAKRRADSTESEITPQVRKVVQ